MLTLLPCFDWKYALGLEIDEWLLTVVDRDYISLRYPGSQSDKKRY